MRVAERVLALAVVASTTACSALFPTTTTAASGPITATADDAVAVFYHRSRLATARGDAISIWEKGRFARVWDERGSPVIDLQSTEHAAIRLPPGRHAFYTTMWGSRPVAQGCVGAAEAELEASRLYVVVLERLGPLETTQCEPIRLVAMPREGASVVLEEIARIGSVRRVFLGSSRETSRVIDDRDLAREIVSAGRHRLVDEPVLLTKEDGLPP